MDPRWHRQLRELADGRHAQALLAGIPSITGFGIVLAWGDMYQRMHAMDATCAESWGRPECQFVLSSLTLLPWTAGGVLLTGLATLEITQAARKLQTLSVGWVGLLAGLSLIASLVALTLGPTRTSIGWAYGSFATLVAATRRITPQGETRRLAPDILLVGLPVLLYVGFVAVLLILA